MNTEAQQQQDHQQQQQQEEEQSQYLVDLNQNEDKTEQVEKVASQSSQNYTNRTSVNKSYGDIRTMSETSNKMDENNQIEGIEVVQRNQTEEKMHVMSFDESNKYNQFITSQQSLSHKERESDDLDAQEFDVFLFANPLSGSQDAKQYIQLDFDICSMNLNDQNVARVYFYDVTNVQRAHKGFRNLTRILKSKKQQTRVIVAIAGGDGSLINTLMELQKFNCDLTKISFVVMPFGSGNDLSQALGWGKDTSVDYLKRQTLKSMIFELCINSNQQFLNVWDVTVTFNRDGDTYVVDRKTKEDKPLQQTFHRRYMINYCSIGKCAEVGNTFDKKRTGNKCCNVCAYCCIGFKMCCQCCPKKQEELVNQLEYLIVNKETTSYEFDYSSDNNPKKKNTSKKTTKPKINKRFGSDKESGDEIEEVKSSSQASDQMQQPLLTVEGGNQQQTVSPNLTPNTAQAMGSNKLLFGSKKYMERGAQTFLKGKPVSIVCTNIPSFMGGWTNPWAKSENRSGLQDPYGKPVQPLKHSEVEHNLLSSQEAIGPMTGRRTLNEIPQAPNDGILEFVTYDSVLDMAVETPNRLGQAQGPIELKFTEGGQGKPDVYSFLNIDGEYFKLKNPDKLKIQLQKDLKDGVINCLVRKKPEDRKKFNE